MVTYKTTRPLFLLLTCAGALPFIFCSLCFVMNIDFIPVLGEVKNIFLVYSLIIASFLSGSHWGQHLSIDNKWHVYLPFISNAAAVSLWIAYLTLAFHLLIIFLITLYLLLLFIDQKLWRDKLIDTCYFKVRCSVTLIVVINMVITSIFA